MNDRFKFRVWCENNQEWEKDTILISNKNMYEIRNDKFTKYTDTDPKNHIINFCTGLKDKNGKLIFEGDVLKIHTVWEHRPYYYAIVKWQRNRYKFQKIGKGVFLGDIAPLKHFANSEVLGNIYENPELLEEQCANQLNRG